MNKPAKKKAPKLTEKQRVFCQEYVLNGSNGAAAARAAKYSERSVRIQAVENLTKPNVVEYIAELRKKIEKDFAVTAKEVITDLRSARDDSKAEGDHSTRIRATELLGKTIGLFIDKNQITVSATLEELADRAVAQCQAMKTR
jgi:phage terminase small subunit